MNKSESKYFNTACLMDEALLYLLENKDFEYITVKEICKKAGVNRSTFYLHYESTDDLLAETIELLNKKFYNSFEKKFEFENIDNYSKQDLIFLKPDYLVPYLTFVKENKRAFKTIHHKPQIFDAEKVFKQMCNQIFNPTIKKFDIPKEQESYIFEYFTKGVLAIIMQWVNLDCKDTVDFIVNMILNCVNIDIHIKKDNK